MKNYRLRNYTLFLLGFFAPTLAGAQGNTLSSTPQKNAITLNLGQLIVNEINLGYEHFLTEKKSIEFNAGLIYRNEMWLNEAKSWTNSQYFHEHGFAARIFYKTYRKTNEQNKRRSYYSLGMNYQYLYFNNEWFETDKDITVVESSGDKIVTKEDIFRHRFRHRIGFQLTLGNIYPLGNNFAVELYYGLGLRGIFSNRFDIARGATINDQQLTLQPLNFGDQKFYVRPAIHAGIKLRLGW